MAVAVGDTLPDTNFVKATKDGPEQIDSKTYFAGRRVAVFSVPGAFTPTCSARHLPGFIEKTDALKAKGIDEVACTAVNDAFVMAAWAAKAGADGKVTMLADGSAAFVTAIGLSVDLTARGMGVRGQRFSMVVDDGKVTQLDVEEPGQYRVSSAEYMLGQL